MVKKPYLAVADEGGKFELKGLPPGDYTVAAVHETLGEQTTRVTVGPKETRDVQFTFGSSAGTAAAQ